MQVMYMAIVYLIRMPGVLSDSARRGSYLSMQKRDLVLERFRLYTEEEESTQVVVNLESSYEPKNVQNDILNALNRKRGVGFTLARSSRVRFEGTFFFIDDFLPRIECASQ
jgi:hypothetical protein